MITKETLGLLLTSDLDALEEGRELGGDDAFIVRFCANPRERGGYGRVVLRVLPASKRVRVDSTTTASGDFLGCADVYTRAAAFIRALAAQGIALD